MGRAQIAIEFVMLAGMAVILLVVILVAAAAISSDKGDETAYNELRDFGASLQRELIVAAEMQEGYNRIVEIPEKINGREYSIITWSNNESYIAIEYKGREIYFATPKTSGEFTKGHNRITKKDGTIQLNP